MRKKQTNLILFIGIVLVSIFVLIVLYSRKTNPVQITFQPVDGFATPWLQFSLAFSAPVDHLTVESAIFIDPPVVGDFVWSEDGVTFQSQDPLEYGENFSVIIKEFVDTKNKLSLNDPQTHQVTIREPNILFISPMDGVISIADLRNNVFPLPSDTVILEIIPSFDGRYFASLTQLAPGNTQVVVQYSQDQSVFSMYQCPQQNICSNLAASPNSHQFLAYDYSRLKNQTSVILLDIQTQTALPILIVPGNVLDRPIWSNQGNQFALFSPSENKVFVTNIDNGNSSVFEIEDLTLGAWAPDDTQIYTRHTHRDVTSTYSHLCVLDLNTGEFAPIESEDLPYGQYGAPLLVPGTTQLLFTKQAIIGENSNQIWLYDFASNTASQLTNEPSYTHGNLHVDISGNFVVYQRINITKSDSTPEIWVWNLETGQSTLVATAAISPQWVQ